MEIKVTISFDEKAHNVLTKLIEAIGIAPRKAPGQTTTTDAATNDEWTEEEMQEAMKQIAEEEAEAMAAEAAKIGVSASKDKAGEVAEKSATEASGAVSDGVEAPKKKKPTITLEQLRALAADVKTKRGSVDDVKKLLNAYGVKNLFGLPEDKMDEFAAKLKELL